jgi:hypothetical protein
VSTITAGSAVSQSVVMVIDSGASKPMCKERSAFTEMTPDHTPVRLANGQIICTEAIGSIGNFSNIYYVPNLQFNLLSVGYLNDLGFTVMFHPSKLCTVSDKKGQNLLLGSRRNGLFYSDPSFFNISLDKSIPILSATLIDTNTIAHGRSMHLNYDYLISSITNKLVNGISIRNQSISNSVKDVLWQNQLA